MKNVLHSIHKINKFFNNDPTETSLEKNVMFGMTNVLSVTIHMNLNYIFFTSIIFVT